MNNTEKYRSWPDDALDRHAELINNEQTRRANLAVIPEQIASLAKTYRDGGGDEAALTEVLTPGQAVPDDAAADYFDYLPEEV